MKTASMLALLLGASVALAMSATAADVKGGVKASTTPEMVKPRPVSKVKEVSAVRGGRVYLDLCALCHGITGLGDGPRTAHFPEGQFIPDLTEASLIRGREDEVLDNIREGLRRLDMPYIVMPQFKYILAEEDIQSVLAYVKTLPDIAAGKLAGAPKKAQ